LSNTPANDLIARAEAAYLGLAIGDALGATVEFMTPREICAAYLPKRGIHREMVGGGWLRLKPGSVTDDTTMSLALGAAILALQRFESLVEITHITLLQQRVGHHREQGGRERHRHAEVRAV